MQEVGYMEAWQAWWNGPTHGLSLWGKPMIFWGRLGQVLQFMAALTILVLVQCNG